jgi:hypothetical protein
MNPLMRICQGLNKQMRKIFISYRREGSFITTGKIYDRLVDFYGHESLFMDINVFSSTVDFRQSIKMEIVNSDIFLVIIGPNWLSMLQEKANDPDDSVRLEIEMALHHNIPVIPIFLGTRVHAFKASDLPDEISKLAAINGFVVDPGKDFEIHMDRLKQDIDKRFTVRERARTASSDSAGSESSQDQDIGKRSKGGIAIMEGDDGSSGVPDDSSRQKSILEGGADGATGQCNSDEREPDEDTTPSEESLNRLEPELELEDGGASIEWQDVYPELDIEFGEVLSLSESLETERERFGEPEGEIELEFELHGVEEDEWGGPQIVHDKDDDIVEADLVDAQKIMENDTLILNTNELHEEGTLVLGANDLAEGGANDLANPDRTPEKNAPNHMEIDNRRKTLKHRFNEKIPSEEKQAPSKKRPITSFTLILVIVIAVIFMWRWF